MKKRAIISWSGGKDSAWMLRVLRASDEYEIVALVTSINEHFDRIAIHGVRRQLLEMQARSAGLPLWTVKLPWPCTNESYEGRMKELHMRALKERVEIFAFGDLFLQDIRDYREKQLSGSGLTPVFPIWGIPTDSLAVEMVRAGVGAKLVCVDPKKLDPAFAGRDFDETFLAELPPGIDRCGENGEFHTFVYRGPMLKSEVPFRLGETVQRDGFIYTDIQPPAEANAVSSA